MRERDGIDVPVTIAVAWIIPDVILVGCDGAAYLRLGIAGDRPEIGKIVVVVCSRSGICGEYHTTSAACVGRADCQIMVD